MQEGIATADHVDTSSIERSRPHPIGNPISAMKDGWNWDLKFKIKSRHTNPSLKEVSFPERNSQYSPLKEAEGWISMLLTVELSSVFS